MRVVHTADLQLGKSFHFVEGDPGALLRRARLEVLDRIRAVAEDPERPAHAVLIAGDLFDANTVEDRVVVQACERLAAFRCPVIVIPGNHDHGGADSVFRSRRWLRAVPPNVDVALDAQPRLLADGRLVILPAPLLRRHEADAVTRALTAELGAEHEGAVRVGLAHGSVHGFDSESELRNEVELEVIERARLDYLALGDWHGVKEVAPRAWYAGTPEPDRFKDNDPGHVLRVEIDAPGALPRVETVRVAGTRWLRRTGELTGRSDVQAIAAWLDEQGPDTLIRLELQGVLSLGDLEELEEVLAHAAARLLHLRRRGGVVPEPTPEELSTIATDGYVRAAVQQLTALSEIDGADAKIAAEALRLLHQLHAEQTGGTTCV